MNRICGYAYACVYLYCAHVQVHSLSVVHGAVPTHDGRGGAALRFVMASACCAANVTRRVIIDESLQKESTRCEDGLICTLQPID